MQIITTREFRANQKKYFELAEKETIFVSRRNAAPIVVYAATEEDFPSREELEAIQRGIEDIKQGRTFKMRKDESLDDAHRLDGEAERYDINQIDEHGIAHGLIKTLRMAYRNVFNRIHIPLLSFMCDDMQFFFFLNHPNVGKSGFGQQPFQVFGSIAVYKRQ